MRGFVGYLQEAHVFLWTNEIIRHVYTTKYFLVLGCCSVYLDIHHTYIGEFLRIVSSGSPWVVTGEQSHLNLNRW